MKTKTSMLITILIYAAATVSFFLTYLLRNPHPSMFLLLGLFFLILSAFQVWLYLRDRRTGQFKPWHEQLCLCPTYAAFGLFWLYRAVTVNYSFYFLLGLGFLAIAFKWAQRIIQAIREDRASGPDYQD